MGFVGADKPWQDEAKAAVRPFAEMRLAQLSAVLGDKKWLEGPFTIGDLVMIDVLRAGSEYDLVATHPNLAAYVERGKARPAFKAAMASQLADFTDPG
jgi:glutathione S-transferase